MFAASVWTPENRDGKESHHERRDSTYYYYFGDGGFVQYTKTPPVGTAQPPKKPANQGEYTLNGQSLKVTWNPTGGGTTIETFYNAVPGARQMNANSNRFSPLVATRL